MLRIAEYLVPINVHSMVLVPPSRQAATSKFAVPLVYYTVLHK